MNDVNPWRLPTKRRGIETPSFTFRMDPLFKQAVQELAANENQLYPAAISLPTILINLSTRNGKYFAERRAWLNKRYKELKQETKFSEKTYFDIKR